MIGHACHRKGGSPSSCGATLAEAPAKLRPRSSEAGLKPSSSALKTPDMLTPRALRIRLKVALAARITLSAPTIVIPKARNVVQIDAMVTPSSDAREAS